MTTSDELANFCHDHYPHPLFWCEEKKRLVERKNAEESLRMWRRRKAEEMARKERDKEEYYELFIKHCPWGRPGGGAPNVDVRRKDITAVGLHSTPTISTAHRLTSLPPCRYSDYFSKRKKCHDPVATFHHHHHHHHHNGNAPRITAHAHSVHHISESARPGGPALTICERVTNGSNAMNDTKNGESLQITLKDHPSMTFRNKGHVDIEVRYKPNKGKPMLEKIVVTDTDKCPIVQGVQAQTSLKNNQKKKTLPTKLEKPTSNKEPWGKSGPGGKPWRSPKAVGSSFMKSLGWTNKEMLKDLDQDNPVTPAEKPTFRRIRPNKKLQRCCELCTCICPAMRGNTLKPLQKKPQSQSSPNKGQNTTKLDTITQKFCPRFVRRCMAPPDSGVICNGKIGDGVGGGGGGGVCDAGNINRITTTTDNSASNVGGGVELVPLLARRRAKNRPISLSSTDVTKRTVSNDSRLTTPADDLRYLHDLDEQISNKRRTTCIAQQLEKDLCNQHFETFDTYWGRPGHGAPIEIKTKLNLDDLLYGVNGYSE